MANSVLRHRSAGGNHNPAENICIFKVIQIKLLSVKYSNASFSFTLKIKIAISDQEIEILPFWFEREKETITALLYNTT